ncbi:UV DNA damage repair endonuclease UvsE [Peribacillus muralis]|uniref:UV DNA damage repair endonuclease UvsE n=1 Tax=Peribacillus muralis TaxID=264697 RepID=UPI001F4D99B3|nr:UV DNA damage repair endonuclease UvsE [Peribacillus muralis]MCK1993434.1 UV DNA damage repair endonuclease UvsE [Peribacillus muralis]MCK2014278.1 UV DNA damage repair endonuclease UvsE [Peribacillus muralis]
MTLIRLGYVAMSTHVPNCSPSQTMTFAQFSKIKDRDAAIRKLERISISNLHNCWRLLIHNETNRIQFFRLSSKLIPLANHPEIQEWDYIEPISDELAKIRSFLAKHPEMRIDFHPDHFIVLNSSNVDILKTSLKTLKIHYTLLRNMGLDPEHRCVLHVGGGYGEHEQALEQFIHNWGLIPETIQRMIILENDDTTYTLSETLYLCEKLGIPMVFDYHHYLAHHLPDENWTEHWNRIITSWRNSKLPPKMHISSPRSDKEYRAHAEYVDAAMFMEFLQQIKGTVPQLDCMIEAKQKDEALFHLMNQLKAYKAIEIIDEASFYIH